MCLMWLPHLPKSWTSARPGSAPASAVRHADRRRRGHALVHKHAATHIITHRCITTSTPGASASQLYMRRAHIARQRHEHRALPGAGAPARRGLSCSTPGRSERIPSHKVAASSVATLNQHAPARGPPAPCRRRHRLAQACGLSRTARLAPRKPRRAARALSGAARLAPRVRAGQHARPPRQRAQRSA